MKALFVDTGVWVALLDAADPLHPNARDLIDNHRAFDFITTDLLLSETVTLVRRELGAASAANFGREFLDGKIGTIVRCNDSDWRAVMLQDRDVVGPT